MNRILAGIVVDEELYQEFETRRYNIGPGWGEVPLKTVEMYAVSKDLEKYPDIREKCREIVEQVKKEIKKYYSAKDGRKEYRALEHLDFAGYMRDVQKIQSDMESKAEEIRNAVENVRSKWGQVSNDKTASEVTRTSWKASYLRAEEDFKKSITELRSEMDEALDEVENRLREHLDDFYAPNGSRIDDAAMALLNAGFPFNETELNRFISGYTNNPTMIRVISAYCKRHTLRSGLVTTLNHFAELRGREEMKIFKSLREFAMLAIRDGNVAPSYQPAFEAAVEKAVASLEDLPVRPGAE